MKILVFRTDDVGERTPRTAEHSTIHANPRGWPRSGEEARRTFLHDAGPASAFFFLVFFGGRHGRRPEVNLRFLRTLAEHFLKQRLHLRTPADRGEEHTQEREMEEREGDRRKKAAFEGKGGAVGEVQHREQKARRKLAVLHSMEPPSLSHSLSLPNHPSSSSSSSFLRTFFPQASQWFGFAIW